MRCTSSIGLFQVGKGSSKGSFDVPAAAAADAAAIGLPTCIPNVQYLPDIAPYPRYGPSKPTVAESDALLGQAEQSWTCKLCNILITAPAGPKARERLREKIDSHKQSRHRGERSKFERLGATTELVTPSDSLPKDQAAWQCHVCQKRLPELSKCQHECSVKEHFRKEHPHVTPTEAYRAKQRENEQLRQRMKGRGRHVGSLKAQSALDSLPEMRENT